MRAQKTCFSLIELAIVVAIIGMLAAVAIPRMSSAADNAKTAVLASDLQTVRDAIGLYAADHLGRKPTSRGIAGVDVNPDHFIERLVGKTDVDGTRNASGEYGPYLDAFPRNPFIEGEEAQASLRINGQPPGAGTHGWYFNTLTGEFCADSVGHEAY